MNTGIGDAVDLSWKLAGALEGWAGAALIDSYDLERRPVAVRNVREASSNLMRMTSLDAGERASMSEEAALAETGRRISTIMKREWLADGVHIGYVYENSPIIWPDGTPPVPDDPVAYTPSARPGGRAPHAWLDDGRSTLDLFGRSHVLLTLDPRAPDPAPLRKAAERASMPLEVVRLDEPEVLRLYERSLVLVRPDGHVAWRGDALPDSPDALVDRLRGARP
jgi:hypothetical protein